MKKSHISVILLSIMVAALAGATGCNAGISGESIESANGVTAPEITVNSTDNSDIANLPESSESVPERKLSDEEMKLVSELKQKSFVGPDGETVKAEDADCIFDTRLNHTEVGSPGFKFNEAVYSYEDDNNIDFQPEFINTVLRYDYAYIRYCRPFFYSGELLDHDSQQEKLAELPENKWFKVKAGDKLDCGLTVKKAVYERFPVEASDPTRDNYIEFEGEITLDGVLFAAQNERDYLTNPGDLRFAPDPTKVSGLPTSTAQFGDDGNIFYIMGGEKLQFVMADVGYNGWIIGTVDDIDSGEIFGDDGVVPVKVTLTNVKYGGIVSYDMPAIYAEIVDIERVD